MVRHSYAGYGLQWIHGIREAEQSWDLGFPEAHYDTYRFCGVPALYCIMSAPNK